MKQQIRVLMPYSSRKSQFLEKQNFPLTSRLPTLTDINSSFLTNRINKSQNKKLFMKTYNNSLNSKKVKISKKLLYVFKDPKEKYKKKFIWPKITHAKLPFTERKKLPKEERKKKIMEQKPSHLFHDFYTIKWLRQKYSDSLIEKSVFSMLPDNGKPVVPDDESEEDKKHRLLLEYLDSLYKQVPQREKYVNINPKYFFDKKTFEKILKFKEIFLEFDEDQSRKMEIDEMVEMFNQNHINANLRDLVNLFFKGKNIKEEDIMKLYLDFYQFMNFALTKDQDFREFMREIKSKNKKSEEDINKTEEGEEETGYLPMTFNLMFDYFLIKGKERASIEAIENSITEMDKIINNDKNEEEKEVEIKSEKSLNKILKNSESNEPKNLIEEENYENSKYYDEQLKNLNFCDLMENFTNLFNVNDLTNHNININEQKKEEKEKSFKNDEDNKSNKKDTLNIKDDNAMTEFLQNKMNKNMIKRLNIRNYKKFHNIKLALNETKEQIKKFMDSKENNINNIYKIQINNENNIKKNKIIEPLLFNNFNKSSKKKGDENKLFNRNNFEKNQYSERNRGIISLDKERKIKIINDYKNYNRNKLKSINSCNAIKKNIKTENNCKYDYVPPDLLKEKIKYKKY